MSRDNRMSLVELIARSLCQCDAINPDGEIMPKVPHWRMYEFRAAFVAGAIITAQNQGRPAPTPEAIPDA